MYNRGVKSLSKIITLGVFVITLIVVLLSLVPVFFPALIAILTSAHPSTTMNPYELGPWALPVLVVNLILLSVFILHRGKMLPQVILKSVRFLSSFEVSRKIAFFTILIILATYVGFGTSRVLAPTKDWPDYRDTYQGAEQFNSINAIKGIMGGGPVVHYSLLHISLKVLGNIRIIPFIESISLLILTYFLTREITQKRFSGIISMVILLQSNIFLRYDADYAYTNAWTLFYILSLYLVQRRQWHLSIVSYILSIFSKALTTIFLPMTLFFIYSSSIPRKTKIVNVVGCVSLSIFITAYAIRSSYGVIVFHLNQFWIGFTALENFLHFDGLILTFLLPLVVGLFVMSRRGIVYADSLMVLISGVLWSTPILVGLTDFTNQPYRLMPLIVFFAIGVGVLFSKRVNDEVG